MRDISGIACGFKPMGLSLGNEKRLCRMIADTMAKLDSRSVGDIIQKGGTFLGTARSEEFKTLPGRQKAVANLQSHGIEGLIVIGGDGSLTGAKQLGEMGIKMVGLPGSIDNDIWGTDYTIGFDTAVNTALEAIINYGISLCHGRS